MKAEIDCDMVSFWHFSPCTTAPSVSEKRPSRHRSVRTGTTLATGELWERAGAKNYGPGHPA
jgi:hypothetical protein